MEQGKAASAHLSITEMAVGHWEPCFSLPALFHRTNGELFQDLLQYIWATPLHSGGLNSHTLCQISLINEARGLGLVHTGEVWSEHFAVQGGKEQCSFPRPQFVTRFFACRKWTY